jgi:superfamily I DNA/RNA helicase
MNLNKQDYVQLIQLRMNTLNQLVNPDLYGRAPRAVAQNNAPAEPVIAQDDPFEEEEIGTVIDEIRELVYNFNNSIGPA